MKTWIRPFALGAAVALATAACETGTDPDTFDDEALRADAALVAADGMFQDLNLMQSPASWGLLGASGPEAAGIEVEGSTSFTKTVKFYIGNEEQARYHPTNTEWMTIVADLTRIATHTFWTAEIHRHREMEVTGLAGEETFRTWNGSSWATVDKSRYPEGGAVRVYDMDTNATFTDIVRDLPRSEHSYPRSGTIRRTVHATLTKDDVVVREKLITFEIVFNNTQFVTMTDVDTGESWPIDLAERGVKRRLHKNG